MRNASSQASTQAQAKTSPAAIRTGADEPKLPRGVAAIVGHHVITVRSLDAWMQEQAGEDFYLATRHKLPTGLVGEPSDPLACATAMHGFAPSSGQSDAQLAKDCSILYRGVKQQALEYLVPSYWAFDFAAAHGLMVSRQEVDHELARYKTNVYNGEANFRRVLASRTRSVGQERFVIESDLVSRKLLPRLNGAGNSLLRVALAHAATATCPPEYPVAHCKGYDATHVGVSNSGPSVRVIMEEMGSWHKSHP